MKAFLSSKLFRIVTFFVLELFSIGMGMGVPFFTIFFGFLVGWMIPGYLPPSLELSPRYLGALLRAALVTSAVTVLLMAILWLPSLQWLFDPGRDLTNFGMPMILYTPRASFVGWIILMVLISPFLQFLMTLFGSVSRIAIFPGHFRSGLPLSGDAPAEYSGNGAGLGGGSARGS